MAPSVLFPPSQMSPESALSLSRTAPTVLRASPAYSALFSAPEKSELWIQYENLVISCLRTGDERAAHECLARLVRRFGADNERVQALSGLIKEAEAPNNAALEGVLKEYDEILAANDTNIVSYAFFRPLLIKRMGTNRVSSLSPRGALHCCGPSGAFPTRRRPLFSSSTSPPPTAKHGPSCRISTSPRACIHRPSTPWRRSWYWRLTPGTYAIRPWDPSLSPMLM